MSERYFFVHLQKTAGTTLFRRLKHHFGAAAVYPMPEYQGEVGATIDVDSPDSSALMPSRASSASMYRSSRSASLRNVVL